MRQHRRRDPHPEPADDPRLAALLGHRDARRRLPLRPDERADPHRPGRRHGQPPAHRDRPGPGAAARQADRRAVGRLDGRLPGRPRSRRRGSSGTTSSATPSATSGAGTPRACARSRRGSRARATCTPTTAARPTRRSTSSPPTTASRCATSCPTTASTTRPTARTTATAPTTTGRGTAASRARPTTTTSLAMRRRQAANLMATLCFSSGVPMLTAGDERGRTQGGNNNAYGQDNEISWIDWRPDDAWLDVYDITKTALRLRREHPVLRQRHWFEGRPTIRGGIKDLVWIHPDGREMSTADWNDDGLPHGRDVPQRRAAALSRAARRADPRQVLHDLAQRRRRRRHADPAREPVGAPRRGRAVDQRRASPVGTPVLAGTSLELQAHSVLVLRQTRRTGAVSTRAPRAACDNGAMASSVPVPSSGEGPRPPPRHERTARIVEDPEKDARDLARVQKWVMSVLAVTTILHLVVGLVVAGRDPRRTRSAPACGPSPWSPASLSRAIAVRDGARHPRQGGALPRALHAGGRADGGRARARCCADQRETPLVRRTDLRVAPGVEARLQFPGGAPPRGGTPETEDGVMKILVTGATG